MGRRLLILAALWLGGAATAAAQPQRGSAGHAGGHAGEHETATISGRVTGYTTAPHGEMDGFTLDSGATVHFPIYAGARLLPLIQKGQRVQVAGVIRPGSAGHILDASLVSNREQRLSVDVAALAAPPLPYPTLPPTPPWGAVAPPGHTPLGQPPAR